MKVNAFNCFRDVQHLPTTTTMTTLSTGRIFVSNFLGSLVSGLLLTSLVKASVDSSQVPARKPDLLFNAWTVLHGHNVTCDGVADSEYRFPAETWSCYNMRVDGLRLRSYYKLSSSDCTDDEKGRNDLGALCRQLLEAHKIRSELWAALIVKNPPCNNSDGERMMFLKTNASYEETTNRSYEWVKYKAGKGYIQTLRCMLMQ